MELFPALQIGWLNGWVLLCILYSVFGILLLALSGEVVRRLYDRSGWSKTQRALTLLGKLMAVIWLAFVIFTPLKLGSWVFILGTTIFALGLAGFVVALFNYKNTPLNQPVTRGLYRISRNPQAFMLLLSFGGISIAIGSWVALLILVISLVSHHVRVLAEEQSCLKQYGDSYRAYMKRVPRYFLLF
jgi:protein-S-isoprenylcysteine O-methyltransferase Ste14